MRFDIMTLFPEMVEGVLSTSIIGRARKSGCMEIHAHNIRDYAENKHNRVDDTPYGGGMGMLMAAPPIWRCYNALVAAQSESDAAIEAERGEPVRRRVIYMSPRGKLLTQQKAWELTKYDNLVLLCGHYEGVDERIIEEIVDEELSVGDYVLTGGELPACIVVDCVSRMLDGVLANEDCWRGESIASGLLEFPQYTRPVEFLGRRVPDVLLSGHHLNIERWRREESVKKTLELRPELLRGDSVGHFTTDDGKRASEDEKAAPIDGKSYPEVETAAPIDGKRSPEDEKAAPIDGKRSPENEKAAPIDGKSSPEDEKAPSESAGNGGISKKSVTDRE